MGKMLLVVDPQNDFLEGGSLAVNGAKEKMDNLASYIKTSDYDVIVITCDWHPCNHSSFTEYGGTWPTHCIAFTKGALIYEPIMDAVLGKKVKYDVLRKGLDVNTEEYSIMDNTCSSKKLIEIISEDNVDEIDCCGICGDVCLKSSIHGMITKHPNLKPFICVLKDFSPSLDDGTILDNFISENSLKSR